MLKFRVTPLFDFGAFLLKAEKYIMDSAKEALVTLCQESVERARQNDGGWHNQTGNLRSSIGGAVYEKGVVFFTTEFEQVLNGSTGSERGKRMVQSLASQYTEAVSMVIIAAMDYAEIVEAVKSKDVLESTRIWAESVVQNRVNEAVQRAVSEINRWKL